MVDVRQSSGTLLTEPLPAAGGAGSTVRIPVLVNQIRLLTDADIPWAIDLGKRRYPHQDWCEETTERWFKALVIPNPLLFYAVRNDGAFLVTMLSILPWAPGELECNVLLACADEGSMWDLVRLMRASIAWCKKRKVTSWRLCSETEFDLGPLARLVGAKQALSRWVLRL